MKKIILAFTLLFVAGFCMAQKLAYDISFPNLLHHEATITLTLTGSKADTTIFRMSRSSPGRYATHEFAKNVYNVKAEDKNGNALIINRPQTDEFEVPGKHDYIRLSYTLYGNYADGTYVDIDENAVLLNAPATFMWVTNLENIPVEIKFKLPAGKQWTIATQMAPTADSSQFTAPGLQYLMDCPVLIGKLTWKQWNILNSDGKTYNIRLALNAATDDETAENFASNLKKLLLEEQAVFTETPSYDYKTYTFLASINPYVNGDGMEHRNSTMITTAALFNGASDLYNTFSHEFFHCWNVERIRPASLEPFNFTHSNISEALWFAEGFTQYYGKLLLARSGLRTVNDFEENMAGWINAKTNTPAGKKYSPIQMSQAAVFTDAGVSRDRNNQSNTFITYYYYGAAIALGLDLELRSNHHTNLDNYMKLVWQRFGKTAVPYTIPGLQQALADLTNEPNFAADFFRKYIYNNQEIDYAKLLASAGYGLQNKNAEKAWIGDAKFNERGNELLLMANTKIGTPLYKAGMDYGDKIISIDGVDLKTETQLKNLLTQYKPGQTVTLTYLHRNEIYSSSLQFANNPAIMVVPVQAYGEQLTSKQNAFRNSWLNSKIGP